MRNKAAYYLFIVLITLPLTMFSQGTDTLSLFDCYRLIREHAPQLGLLNIQNRAKEIEDSKLSSKNLPQLSAYGKAWYQSDAITVSFPIPGVTGLEVDRFQYNAGVNIDQKLLDGGLVSIQRRIKAIESEINNLETEAALYKLNELVNTHFFNILSISESVKLLELKIETLEEQRKVVESGVKNGILTDSELERISSEIVYSNLQLTELIFGKTKLENSLSTLVGRKSNPIVWVLPEEIEISDSVSRTEHELFRRNINYLESLHQLQSKKYIPKIIAYGQAGYSYPGLNFFENQSDVYYIIGAKLSWQIFDWNEGKKEKELISFKKEMIEIAEAEFDRNLQILILNTREEIEMLQEFLVSDKVILTSKQKITKASASSLKNGAITTSDYLKDLNAELKANIDHEVHKVRLMQAKANMAVIKGMDFK